MTIARFMNFYPAYDYEKVLAMDAPTFDFLCECMIKAKANSDLEDIEIVSYPHLKDAKVRNKVRNQIKKRAETQQQLEERVVSSDELEFFGVKVGSIEDHIKR